jgi:chromosome segregation and condensation protein ScpB
MDPLKRVIEALLFSSERPLSAEECVKYLKTAPESAPEDDEVRALAKTKQDEIAGAMRELHEEYAEQERGFCLVESAAGWKVVTTPGASPWSGNSFPRTAPPASVRPRWRRSPSSLTANR